MQLTVESLKAAGAFAPARPEQDTITWFNQAGEPLTATVYVRKRSFNTVLHESQSNIIGSHIMAARIASSIVNEKGEPVFNVDDITGNDDHGPMCESLAMALLGVISKVNGMDDASPKTSPPKTNSGTNLSLPESAETQSNKPEKT